MTNTVATRNAVPKGVTILFGITAVVITVTLALGSTVCATDASASCPNWPGCYVGRLTPMDATQPWVEFIHRVISASVGIFAVASVIVGIVYRRVDRLLVALPIVALLGALTSGIFGMMTIKWGINAVEASFDLLAAIISMGAMWRGSSSPPTMAAGRAPRGSGMGEPSSASVPWSSSSSVTSSPSRLLAPGRSPVAWAGPCSCAAPAMDRWPVGWLSRPLGASG